MLEELKYKNLISNFASQKTRKINKFDKYLNIKKTQLKIFA